MRPAYATVRAARDFDLPAAVIFAHWTSPETRVRWEAGPDTGMRYDAFDTRPGGVETVRVFNDGEEIGHMIQRIHAADPAALVTCVEGHFGGRLTMVMIVSIRFIETAGGCRLEATAQVTDLTGTDPTEQHEAGWAWILDRFARDLAEYGPAADTPQT